MAFIVNKKNELRTNRQIRVPEVRVLDRNGNMLGVFATQVALKMAEDDELDLIEISPNANPPLCKIFSYSKYKYEEQKRLVAERKKQKVVQTKEIKMSLNIGDGDFNTKMKHTINFINDGDKVKFNFVFRGREITYSDNAQLIIDKILKQVELIAKIEEKPKMEGKKLFFTIAPIAEKTEKIEKK
ncbi:MAG: translation initiation factor IF-3 [Rickettsiales bacterium]|nr:MAG: translation initiation factor IF-3 [Rickettsiales bacterium]